MAQGSTEITKPPEAASFHRSWPGTVDQVRQVRQDLAPVVNGCPLADDFIVLASELSTNAIVHSRSGQPGGVFTVRAEVRADDYAWLEVEDQGGPWIEREPDEEHGRGLAMVAALAGEGNWTVEGGSMPGTRVVRVWLDWRRGERPCTGTPPVPPIVRLGSTRRRDDDMIAVRCSCGFTELADEEITDHLEWVFEPDDLRGNDGLVHEERGPLACACGLSVVTPDEMDAHFVTAFTPGDAIGRDGQRHELVEARDGA